MAFRVYIVIALLFPTSGFAAPAWRRFACAALLGAVGLTGCQEPNGPKHPSNTHDRNQAIAPQVITAPSIDAKIFQPHRLIDIHFSREIFHVFTGEDGTTLALEWMNRHLRVHKLDRDLRVIESRLLGAYDHKSTALVVSPNQFEIALGSSEILNTGEIQQSVHLYRFDTTRPLAALNTIENRKFSYSTYAYQQGLFLSHHEAQKRRARTPDRLQTYREHLLAPGTAELTLFGTEKRDLLWQMPSESGVYSFGTQRFSTTRPWLLNQEEAENTGHWIGLTSQGANATRLASTGSRDSLGILYRTVGLTPPTLKEDVIYLSALTREPEKYRESFAPIATQEKDVDLVRGIQTAEQDVFVGNTHLARTKTGVWVGVVRNGRLQESRFQFGDNAMVTGALVDPTSKHLFVFGRGDFHQAISGSISHSQGFVLHLDSDLKEIGRYRFRGDGSTRVLSVQPILKDKKSHLIVAGFTQGPDTHDRREPKSFIQVVELTQSSTQRR